jgi:hypothetical protein
MAITINSAGTITGVTVNPSTTISAAGTGTSIPNGWTFDAANQRYLCVDGSIVTQHDIMRHGSFMNVLIARASGVGAVIAGGVQSAVGQTSSPTTISNGTGQYVHPVFHPGNKMGFDTAHGRVTIDIDTGDLTLPAGMSRVEGIREFWLGFQKYFKSGDIAKYENEIKVLKEREEKLKKDAEHGLSKKVADKIRTKYNGQKLIMVKPEDLAKFIEDVT